MGEMAYSEYAGRRAISYMAQAPRQTLSRIALRMYVWWFTDIFDNWSWHSGLPWWKLGFRSCVRRVTKVTVVGVPVLALIALACLGWLSRVSYRCLFLLYLGVVPIPYYLSLVSPLYASLTPPYVMMLVALMVALRFVPGRPEGRAA
jgi:hypothetical protein